jgi:hypothetical protein
MRSIAAVAIATMAVSTRTYARPVQPATVGEGYGTFCDSNDCSGSGSVAFSIGNAGYIANEVGKSSIYIQAPKASYSPSLVWSPGTDCNCQNHCEVVMNFASSPNDNGCWDLNGKPNAQSFRFI